MRRIRNKEPSIPIRGVNVDKQSPRIFEDDLKISPGEILWLAVDVAIWLLQMNPKFDSLLMIVLSSAEAVDIVNTRAEFISLGLLNAKKVEAQLDELLSQKVQFASMSLWWS